MPKGLKRYYQEQLKIRQSGIFPLIVKEMGGKVDSMAKLEKIIDLSQRYDANVAKYVNAILVRIEVLDPKSHSYNKQKAEEIATYLKCNNDFLRIELNWNAAGLIQKEQYVKELINILEKHFSTYMPHTKYETSQNMPKNTLGYVLQSPANMISYAKNLWEDKKIVINTSPFALNTYPLPCYVGTIIHERHHTAQPIHLSTFKRNYKSVTPDYFYSWHEQDAKDIETLTLQALARRTFNPILKGEYIMEAADNIIIPTVMSAPKRLFMKKLVLLRGHLRV